MVSLAWTQVTILQGVQSSSEVMMEAKWLAPRPRRKSHGTTELNRYSPGLQLSRPGFAQSAAGRGDLVPQVSVEAGQHCQLGDDVGVSGAAVFATPGFASAARHVVGPGRCAAPAASAALATTTGDAPMVAG